MFFACQAYPTHTAAGRGWFAGLGRPLVEYAASLRFQTSALALPRRGGELDFIRGHEQVMAGGRPDP
jgi:hypothetical protein